MNNEEYQNMLDKDSQLMNHYQNITPFLLIHRMNRRQLYYPGFPSIFIIYTKTNDIYFSGHTGCMTVFFFIHLFRRLKK